MNPPGCFIAIALPGGEGENPTPTPTIGDFYDDHEGDITGDPDREVARELLPLALPFAPAPGTFAFIVWSCIRARCFFIV